MADLKTAPGEAHEAVDVSVVLPVYNEAGHLVREIDRVRAALDASPYRYEIVAVDDGSTDGSGELLAGIPGIRLLRFATNRGSGASRKVGTRAARGRVVVWTDVDMSYPNDEIPRLVKELDGYDQVVGARTSEQGTVKALRVPAKWLIAKLASYLAETRIPDLNSGLRAFRRDVALQYLHLLPAGFSCVTTMTMTFLANGYSVRFVPIDYAPRAGQSKFHWWVDTRRYVRQVLRMVLLYNPLKVFLPFGFTLLTLGIAKLAFDLTVHHFHVAADTLVILGAAVSVIMLGVLADLLVLVSRSRDEVDPATL
ncbi:MAG: glycosyltransferase family 2 protein [Acidimicrobiales bacterium]